MKSGTIALLIAAVILLLGLGIFLLMFLGGAFFYFQMG